MKPSRPVTVAALLLATIALASGGQAASSEQRQPVIVTLREQADLGGINGGRENRLREVVLRSQALATRSQRPFAALMTAWARAGQISRFTPMWIFNGFSVEATPQVIKALQSNPAVASVRPDLTTNAPDASAGTLSPTWNISLVSAPALWDLGITGQGVLVGSLDTGVDPTHADLSGRWRGGTNSWYDPFGQHTTAPIDLNGHGTQVMGVIVGGDAGGSSIGVAPGARWIGARIYNDRGQGTTSATHLAFQWLLDPDHNPNTADAPQVVNNSWTYGSGVCTLEYAPDIQALRAAGILPIFAAGNYGSINASPANNPGAFAVGATTSTDAIASFSSRGPSSCGEPSTLFPEITAPGVSIRTSDLFGGYATLDGTSLAAPHVAGALALLLSANPGLTVAEQETALETGAHDLGAAGPDTTFGFGRLDIPGAYAAVATPGFTIGVAPSSASTLAGGTVSYTVASNALNGFTGDVTIATSGLPAGVSVALAPSVITGASGTSQLTLTTPPALAAGTYPFTISGTSGTSTHTVGVSLVVQPPPDFGLSAAPSAVTVVQGGTATYTVAVTGANGFAGTVTLSLSGLSPSQATSTFTPQAVAGSGSSQLAVTTSTSVTPGSYLLTVTGVSGSLAHSTPITLTVTPIPDFTLGVTPASVTLRRNGQVTAAVSVGSLGGFSSAVTLSVTGLPSGVTATFAPNPASPGGSSTLTLRATRRATLGQVTLTITGVGGGKTHTKTLVLNVTT
jgi:subtilisin family serine protease